MVIKRFDGYLVKLDPTIGSEIKKTRPCLIISPDELNEYFSTIIVAPMTTRGRDYPSRVNCHFEGKDGQIVLDQVRTVYKTRLGKKLGKISLATQKEVTAVLLKLFAE